MYNNISGTTKAAFTAVATPSITIEGYPDNIDGNPELTSSSFIMVSGSQTHVSTD
jgi:hypothetical protein